MTRRLDVRVTIPTRTDRRAAANVVSDAEIIRASLTDGNCFADLFDRHWEDIHRFCIARLGSGGEDVAAETFRVAFTDRERFDRQWTSARPWLFGIATNLIRRHHRSSERQGRALLRLVGRQHPAGSEADRVAEQLDARRAAGPAMRALDSLRAEEREIVLLFAWADLTYAEIADGLELPIGTVRSRLSRARRKLRSELGDESV